MASRSRPPPTTSCWPAAGSSTAPARPWFYADVAIAGDRIAAIGDLSQATARTRVDATGLVVAPGFIDMLGQSEFNVLVDGRAASKIMMGVTTEITGEGGAIAPVNDRMVQAGRAQWDHFGLTQDFRTLAEYFTRLETRSKPAINLGTFVGAGGIRDYVIGRENRPATPADLEQMKTLVAQAMQHGALGLSTSLQYVPDRFATHRGAHRARQGRAPLRRRLPDASTLGERPDLRVDRRSHSHQPRSQDSGRDLAPEDRLQGELGQDAAGARAARGGARPRARRHRQPVSVHARVERARRVPAAVGARRRYRRDDRPPPGSGAARAHQARDGRSERHRLGEPVARLGRRRRRDGVVGAERRAAQVRRHDAHRDWQGDGQGSARCGDGPRHRRSRRDRPASSAS